MIIEFKCQFLFRLYLINIYMVFYLFKFLLNLFFHYNLSSLAMKIVLVLKEHALGDGNPLFETKIQGTSCINVEIKSKRRFIFRYFIYFFFFRIICPTNNHPKDQ